MIVCDEAVKKLGLSRESTRVIVQGFGNVGSNAARLMTEAGYKIIGIVEVDGGLLQPERHRHRRALGIPPAQRHHPRLPRRRSRWTRQSCWFRSATS